MKGKCTGLEILSILVQGWTTLAHHTHMHLVCPALIQMGAGIFTAYSVSRKSGSKSHIALIEGIWKDGSGTFVSVAVLCCLIHVTPHGSL